jgi:hypothetical protein
VSVIWKYPLWPDDARDVVPLDMPANSQILAIQFQEGAGPCLWALVDPQQPTEQRQFRVVGTGHSIDEDTGQYLGTFQMMNGALVFHVFEATYEPE